MKVIASILELICLLLIALPVAIISYMLLWAAGGWAAGAMIWKFLHKPENGS